MRPIVRHPPRPSQLYIGGDWVASTGAATIDVVNPTTGTGQPLVLARFRGKPGIA